MLTQRLSWSAGAALFLSLGLALLVAQTAAQPNGARGPGGDGFPDLVGGLRATEGCMGVETARTSSGKNVIFAWFEDKAAVKRWYDSDTHAGAARAFFPQRELGEPMAGVADDAGPFMVIASITMVERSRFQETDLPISQIAIEIYEPVTGGIYLGEKFAPDAVQPKGMQKLGG